MKRIWHPWTSWECYPAGFYSTVPPVGMDADGARDAYRAFLSDLQRFDAAITEVLRQWTHSCEHFLTNDSLNRIAWLGQASMCISTSVSSHFRGGFKLLSPDEQRRANSLAASRLRQWERDNAKGRAVHSDVAQARLFD